MKGVKHDWIIRETKPDGDIYVIRESMFESGAEHTEVLCENEHGLVWVPANNEVKRRVAHFRSLGEAAAALAEVYFGDEPCGQ